jgi:signal peptidase I
LVQQELHPSDEGRPEHGNTSEPRPDETAAGIPETLKQPTFATLYQSYADPAGPVISDVPPGFIEPGGSSYSGDLTGQAAARPTELEDPAQQVLQRLNVWKDELVAWFKTLASAAVYATLIVTFGFQVARVEGQSMAPTLADQDRLIVNKFAYRIGIPRRGDIVMLYYPINPDKSFVKRVIAEEGDTVRIVDGRVYVNDVPMDDSFVPPEYRSHDDFGPEVIKEGYYFVMGDHRNNSSDSRHWGFVPKKYIIGKVQLRWWPMGHARVF